MNIENLISEYTPMAMDFGIRLIVALVIFIVGKSLAGLVSRLLRNVLKARNVDPTVEHFLGNLAHSLMLALLAVIVLSQLGVETASLIAVLGAAGLAVGLALQGSLANFASGVLLLALRPCRAGDYVDAGGCSGTIEKIDILATTMVTPDNKVVVVPNACIMGGPITNYSAKETRRIDLTLGVSYDADLNQVKSIINELLAQDDRILKDPAPTVAVVALADSSINLVVRPWVKKADYWNCYFDLQQGMKEAMDRNNISIPFPQVDVHFDNNAHFDNK